MNIYLGFGHPLPLWLAVVGIVDLIVTPIAFAMYVREALGPHPEVSDASDTDVAA